MDFFDKLAGFLITKHAIRSYQKNLENEYYRQMALLEERERRIRAAERAEEERRKHEEKIRRMIEENDERHRQMVLVHEARMAEHEAKIEQLKQLEGDHTEEIEQEKYFAEFERDMANIYKNPFGESENL